MDSVFCREGSALIWQSFGETLRIEPWGADSFRVRAVMMSEITDTDYALLLQPEIVPVIEIESRRASITNGRIRAELTLNPWGETARIAFYNQDGKLLLREIDRGGCLALHARAWKPILGGDFTLTASFDANKGEKLYGMGQYQQELLDIKGCTFELAHRNAQASVPFLLSSNGYGFFWHNPAIGRATFASNRSEWRADSTKQLDYWITAGDSPREILASYMNATGKPPMMPEYGLGFWQCKLRYWNQEQLLNVAREHKRRGLPMDVIVCDFFHWPHLGDFCFEEEFFPDPAAMAKELADMGITLMVSVWPQIGHNSVNFKEMHRRNLLVKPERGVNVCMQFGGDSVFFDATNPEARKFVWEKCKENYYDNGVRMFWLDEAEPEYATYEFDNYRYHIGSNAQIGNVYPQMFSRAFYEGMQAEGHTEIVNLVRCAWAGSQRYGALVWSGDVHSSFEDFRRQVVAGLQMGMSGIPWWTSDIGGFLNGLPSDPTFRELIVRWFQYGAFCPVMRLHGDRATETPEGRRVYRADGSQALFTGGENEVWTFGDDAYEIMTAYLRLRENLRPLTRELMRETHEVGSPIMRALFYEFPNDADCWDIADQYMFGGDILVAPVMEKGACVRDVYLPEGCRWTDAWTGREYDGGQTIAADAPLHIIPIFLRGGKHIEMFNDVFTEKPL